MLFGNEHFGKAVAILRDRVGLSQKDLAQKIDVQPNTMNQYERGRRSMNEETVGKIAEVCERDPVEIWDMAYLIFRFNYFRERAEREGLSVKELIARSGISPSPEAVLNSVAKFFDSLAANVPQLLAGVREGAGLGLMEVVVESPPQKSSKARKAVGSSRKKLPKEVPPKEVPAE